MDDIATLFERFMVAQAMSECYLEMRPVCLFNHPSFPDGRFVLFDKPIPRNGLLDAILGEYL